MNDSLQPPRTVGSKRPVDGHFERLYKVILINWTPFDPVPIYSIEAYTVWVGNT